MSERIDEKLKLYEQLCISYRGIDDFRAKLLGFLPLATGTGIFTLLNIITNGNNEHLLPIGIFGIAITLGLFAFEIYGIKKCAALIFAGKKIELSLDIDGQFKSRPQNVLGRINEPFASGVIYPGVLAAWAYLAFYSEKADSVPWISVIVFLVFFAGTLIYDNKLRKEYEEKEENYIKNMSNQSGLLNESEWVLKTKSSESEMDN